MGIKEYKKIIDRTGRAQLILVNDSEAFCAGDATDVVRLNNDKLKLRWKIQNAVEYWHPFTHAVLCSGNKVSCVYEITPFYLERGKGTLGLVFDI